MRDLCLCSSLYCNHLCRTGFFPFLRSEVMYFPFTSSSQPVGHDKFEGSNDPFPGVTCEKSCMPDIYITTQPSRKITVMTWKWSNFIAGSAQHAWGAVLRVTALGRVRSTGLGCNFKWFRSYGLCQCLFLLFFFQQNLLQLTGILVEKRITWFSASESKVLCVGGMSSIVKQSPFSQSTLC